ncbi:MAG: alpha/beta fold hydrolase [Actinobacteria bacterium]|nr:alpha/beta fold hydrolase [Actinomycetota bacterium]MDQ3163842.1 alpha/beta fold hydrolase [Actinomycetota bacterium]
MTAATTVEGIEERIADLAGTHLRYLSGGSGSPVILLHGLGGSSSNWIELLGGAAERFRVLAPDLPGHGRSARLPARAGVTAFADAVAALLEHEHATPALVVGHSFGGLVGLRLAHRRPDLVRGLLLVAPAGIRSGASAVRAAILVSMLVRPARLAAPFRHRYAARAWYRRALFRPWFVSDPLALSARATLGFLESSGEHVDIRTAARALVLDDPRRDLEHVGCSVVIVWGARDQQLPLDDAFEYTRRLRAKLRVVADCGHLVIGERPQACLGALDELARATRDWEPR